MRSLIPRWRPWFSRYSSFSRGFYSINHPPGCYPPGCVCPKAPPASPPVSSALCFSLRSLSTGCRCLLKIQSDQTIPIKYVATLAAFLARLRPHKSELSPNKTQSEQRESNSWVTSSLKMISVLTMTKSPPCLVCLYLRTSNSSAAYLMVLVTTSSPCLTWLGAYARLRPYSSHNRKRRLRSPCGTRSPIDSYLPLIGTQ